MNIERMLGFAFVFLGTGIGDALPKLLNFSSWSLFLGILMLGGGQIAGIGVKLLKRN